MVFLERVILPEEQSFEAAVTSRMTPALEMLEEWRKERGKERRLATLQHFRHLEAFFQEQVSLSLSLSQIGRERCMDRVLWSV